MRFFILSLAALLIAPVSAHAALLYIEPSGTAFGPGDTFIATVRIDVEGECMNTGRIVVTYPKETVKPVDFSRGKSIFSLWITEPSFENADGDVVFEGGIPGGYCGRIQGDPALSNVLGEIIFTVLSEGSGSAVIEPNATSEIYASDGLGTRVPVDTRGATVTLLPQSVGAENPWITAVENDDIPPNSFTVYVESTDGVFNGDYYAIFLTTDKQSGLSHYEIFERGVWKKVVSPYRLKDQSLEGGVTVRAIDKAGNERVVEFDPTIVPERKSAGTSLLFFSILIMLVIVGAVLAIYFDRKKKQALVPPL